MVWSELFDFVVGIVGVLIAIASVVGVFCVILIVVLKIVAFVLDRLRARHIRRRRYWSLYRGR